MWDIFSKCDKGRKWCVVQRKAGRVVIHPIQDTGIVRVYLNQIRRLWSAFQNLKTDRNTVLSSCHEILKQHFCQGDHAWKRRLCTRHWTEKWFKDVQKEISLNSSHVALKRLIGTEVAFERTLCLSINAFMDWSRSLQAHGQRIISCHIKHPLWSNILHQQTLMYTIIKTSAKTINSWLITSACKSQSVISNSFCK